MINVCTHEPGPCWIYHPDLSHQQLALQINVSLARTLSNFTGRTEVGRGVGSSFGGAVFSQTIGITS